MAAEAAVENDKPTAWDLTAELLARDNLPAEARLRATITNCRAGTSVNGPKASLPRCEQAVELGLQSDNRTLLLRARNVRGAAFFELGEATSAYRDFSAALILARQVESDELYSRLANNLGVVTRNTGALEQAIKYFEESIEFAKQSGYDIMLAAALINLGDSFIELERYDGALPYFRTALEVAQRTDDETLVLSANLSIGATLLKQGFPAQAVAHLLPLISPANAHHRNTVIGRGYEVLADAYSELGRNRDAIGAVNIALSITAELDAILRHNRLLVKLAKFQSVDGNLAAALTTITKPLAFAREQDHEPLLRAALREQTDILAALGRPDEALASDREAHELEQTFNAERANEQLSILAVSAEQAETERELALALQRQTAIELGAQQDRRVRNGALLALAFVLGLIYLLRHRRRSQELEHLVEKRTQALQEQIDARETLEAQLVQSQKLEAIGQLTGGIAHDFTDLLTVIVAALDMLRNDSSERLNAEELGLIDDALSASQSGTEITQQLLAFARKQDLRPEEFDLTRQIQDLARLLTRSLGVDRQLTVSAPATPLWVQLDRAQLTTALLNLVINARDATAMNGTVTIELTEQHVRSGDGGILPVGSYASIAIRDNGRGMPTSELQQACDPFFTTKPFAAGSGLGLSMVYGFVKQSAGEMIIASQPGRGTEIKLMVPLVGTPEQTLAELEPDQPNATSAPRPTPA